MHDMTPDEEVLDALLISTALLPRTKPKRKSDRYLMGGWGGSNLQIEPALRAGATEIVALDLMDSRDQFAEQKEIGCFLTCLTFAVEKRQADLEMELAIARKIPIVYIRLVCGNNIPFWDFRHTHDLIDEGYVLTLRAMRKKYDKVLRTMWIEI